MFIHLLFEDMNNFPSLLYAYKSSTSFHDQKDNIDSYFNMTCLQEHLMANWHTYDIL